MAEPLLFVNIGWMEQYNGRLKSDRTIGNHKWLKTHNYGHESWNFRPYRGKLYGYVPGAGTGIVLRRLGGSKSADSLSDVTVVWIARNPRDCTTYIVGWYRNATVYRETGQHTIHRAPEVDVQYQIVSTPKDAILLAPDQRLFEIPTKKVFGNLGQSPLWYGGTDKFRSKVREYLARDGALPTICNKSGQADNKQSVGGSPRQADSEVRKQIELAAIQHATRYYRSTIGGTRIVESVEGDNIGWDLTVTAGAVVLKVEVKGLSGRNLSVELTPNEYKQMHAPAHRSMYVIYVVTEAGTKNAKSHIFYYDAIASKNRNHVWKTKDGSELQVKKLIGARLTVRGV